MCGCSGVDRPSLSIESVAPNRVTSLTDTAVVVRGERFDDAVAQLDVSSTTAPRIDRSWRVSLEGIGKQLTAEREDAKTLRFTVPAGLAAGRYALTVHSPSGARATLEAALTVVDEPVVDPAYELSIETNADGSGEVVSDRVLGIGEALSLYAVVRTDSNEVVASEFDIRWRATGLEDVLGEAQGMKTVFSSDAAGSAVVIATHAVLGEARTGTLSVRSEKDRPVLAIEDAPSGEGTPIEARMLTTDDALTVYAVSRDAAGKFLADLEVEWSVSGGIGAAPEAPSSSFTLVLTRPGEGQITAEADGGSASTGTLRVRAGRAAVMAIEPMELSLSADADPVGFKLAARDADGNVTQDLGSVTWAIDSGEITALDPATGVLDPGKAGSGVVRAWSSHGPIAKSGEIQIEPGRVARLTVEPDTLSISADDPAVTFSVASAFDADDNPTTKTGVLLYSIASGDIATLTPLTGRLDPVVAGTGTIRVTSVYGATDVSGPIEIRPGTLASLTVTPNTLTTTVGDAPTTFSAIARDADGNMTLDTGSLSYSVASGSFGTLDAVSGKLTPDSAGAGTLRVTSSLGPSDDSGAIVVRPSGPLVEISSIIAPAMMSRGQGLARFEIKVQNNSPDQTALLSSVWLEFLRNGTSVANEYSLFLDSRNSYTLAPNASTSFVIYVSASAVASTGAIQAVAHVNAFVAGSDELSNDLAHDFTMLGSSAPIAVISRPIPPENRVCAGGMSTFSGNGSSGGTSFTWSFENGTPATSTMQVPGLVTYTTPGRHLVSLTLADSSGDRDSAYTAVFVGTAESVASATYPTGSIFFTAPAAGGVIDLAGLPADDELAISSSGSESLRQCNGTAVPVSGNRFVTLWTDRGVIEPSQDVRADLPGIQIALANGGTSFNTVDFAPGSPALEGVGMVYAEYYNPTLGVVTAAGGQLFFFDNDTEAPSLVGSRPASDCANCFGPNWPWVFQFSEPLDAASIANLTVLYRNAPSCFGAFNDVTASSTLFYDAPARMLYVRPPVFTGTYTIRVALSGLRDASSNDNPLPSIARCVQVSPMADVAPPSRPNIIGYGPDPFSPDGDAVSDTIQLTARVSAEARVARLEITRGPEAVRTLIALVNDAGDVTFTWDGRDYTGRIASDGVYRYEVSAENAEGEASEVVVGTLQVDGAPHFVGVSSRY